jgi:hypothetical protein
MTAISYTLNEWLRLRKISRAQWYRTPQDDKPDLYGKGRMQRISSEADARWLEKQERKAGRARQNANASDNAAA